MSRWREGWMLWAGAALILLVNAVALGGVAYNRSAERARVTLTERELALPWAYGSEPEDSGLALQLQWRVAKRPGTQTVDGDLKLAAPDSNYDSCRADWLDEAKLASLGFDLPPETHETDGSSRGGSPVSRTAWLLLELDGDTHRAELAAMQRWSERMQRSAEVDPSVENAREAADAKVRLQGMREHASRLYVVDAAIEPEALLPPRPGAGDFFVARGRIDASRHEFAAQRRWCGRVEAVDIESVHVSTQFQPTFAPLVPPTPRDGPPRYEVTLAYGRRYEPWIVAARVLAQP